MTDERRRRPEPPRTRPIRNWSTLFPQSRPAPGANGTAEAPAADGTVVARSVELGYRIIDDYIRQGEQVARRVGERALDPAGMARDAQDMTTRMTGYATQMTTLWMEAMQGMAGGALPAMPAGTGAGMPGWWGPASPPPADAARGPLPRNAPAPEPVRAVARVRVVVEAQRPVEVALDLRPGTATRLSVHALRSADGGAPRLSHVALEPPRDDEPWTLRIRVPADHPPGSYAGAITDDDTAEAVGAVHVHLPPP